PVFTVYSVTLSQAAAESKASEKVSQYLKGSRPDGRPPEQLQFNPPNLPLFKQGTVPFLGDYIDIAPAPAFVPAARGSWLFNTSPANAPIFHVVWTDNRDVSPPSDGNWAHYTPPIYNGPFLDPGQQLP